MRFLSVLVTLGFLASACAPGPDQNGGNPSTGGTSASGGKAGSGGTSASGGKVGSGGTSSSGGKVGTGGRTVGTGGSQPPASVDCQDTSGFVATVTGQYETAHITVDGNANKTYFMQANWWGSPWNNQTERINGLGFTMTNPPPNNVTSNKNNPMGFPSIYIGAYQGRVTKGSNLPKLISSISSVPTVFSTNADQIGWTGYNATYDVWLTQSSSALSAGASSPCPGAYLMVWLFKTTDKQPRGNIIVDGHDVPGVPGAWTVWVDDSSPTCSCVSYVSNTKLASLEFDLNLFMQDAINKKYGNISGSQYLSIVNAGFEVWSGADGLQLKKFCANVK
jgi:hypothetical protein